jgi:hypothetical protein
VQSGSGSGGTRLLVDTRLRARQVEPHGHLILGSVQRQLDIGADIGLTASGERAGAHGSGTLNWMTTVELAAVIPERTDMAGAEPAAQARWSGGS